MQSNSFTALDQFGKALNVTDDENSKNSNIVDTEYLNVCPECDKSFQCNSDMVSHFLKYHEKVEAKYSCNICNFVAVEKCSLKRHIESTHKGKYSCDQCNKQFTMQKNLTKHLQSKHEGVKYV